LRGEYVVTRFPEAGYKKLEQQSFTIDVNQYTAGA
jgi:hypothetical protein